MTPKPTKAGRGCSVDDCARPHYGRGFCRQHWLRWRRTGDPGAGKPLKETRTFWEWVDRAGPDDCWVWTGTLTLSGYGSHSKGRAHRVAYEMAVGPIPSGMTLDHTCHNNTDCRGGDSCPHRRCCNPAHLEAVTIRENTLRSPNSVTAVNARKTHCKWGHEFTPENTKLIPGGRECRTCRKEISRRHQLTRPSRRKAA